MNTVSVTRNLLLNLGFILNEERSVLIPYQIVIYFFIIDTILMIVRLTKEKQDKVIDMCNKLLRTDKTTVRELAQVIGVLLSTFPAVEFGKLFYRELEKKKI